MEGFSGLSYSLTSNLEYNNRSQFIITGKLGGGGVVRSHETPDVSFRNGF